MIIDIFGIDRLFFDDHKDNVLVIKDANIFSQIINSLFKYCNGKESDLVILSDDKIITKNQLLLINDIIGFDFQSKYIINKLNSKICNQILSDIELELELMENIDKANNIIHDILFEYNLNIEINTEKQIENYVKYLGLKLRTNFENILDKMLDIIEVISELFPEIHVIIVNQLLYFDKNQILEIFKYKSYKKCSILFIERNFEEIDSINRIVIDEDYYVY